MEYRQKAFYRRKNLEWGGIKTQGSVAIKLYTQEERLAWNPIWRNATDEAKKEQIKSNDIVIEVQGFRILDKKIKKQIISELEKQL